MAPSVTHNTPFAREFGAPIYRHLSWLSLLIIFLTDFFTPLGFAHGTLYLCALFLSIMGNNRQSLLHISLASTLLCSAGLVIAAFPQGVSYPLVIANRLVSLVAIAIVLSLGLLYLQLHRKARQKPFSNADTLPVQARQEKWLNSILRSTGAGLWWYDATREKLHWSPEVTRLHGLPAGTSIEFSSAINFYSPPYDERIQTLFRNCLENGISYSEELELETADGRKLWVTTSGEAQTNEQGVVIAVLGTIADITRAKHLADKLNDTQRQLRYFLNATPMIVWTAKADGTIDYFSPALVDFSGVCEEVLSEPGHWLSLVHPNDQDQCTQTWSESVRTETAYRIDFRIRRHDGEYLWHHVKADPVYSNQGKIIKWYGSAKEHSNS